jgi:dihydrofolate reductase
MESGPQISLIVAMSTNRVIGRNGEIPWYLPDDLKHFKKITTQAKNVIVGRKTHEAILKGLGRTLPERRTIVLTRRQNYQKPSFEVACSWENAMGLIFAEEEALIIGGAEVYKLALPYVQRLYVTEIEVTLEGDAHFPDLDPREWEITESIQHPADEKHKYAFCWKTLERRKS